MLSGSRGEFGKGKNESIIISRVFTMHYNITRETDIEGFTDILCWMKTVMVFKILFMFYF